VPGDIEPTRRPEWRISEVDRDRAMQRLQQAVGRGLLTLDDFTERADRVLAAGTRDEIDAVLVDLALAPPPPPTLVLRTTNGSVRQAGRWAVPGRIVAHCDTGRVRVDFTEAHCDQREIVVEATCERSGYITLIVPPGWTLRVDELSASTGKIIDKTEGEYDPSAPLLRLFARPGTGRIKIKNPRRW
jgi:hypothetical protein